MPRPASTEPKTRLSLELPERTKARLERVVALSEADSKTEAIRRALTFYEELILARDQRCRIIMRAEDGTEREILVV